MPVRSVVTTVLIFTILRFGAAQVPRRGDAYDLLLHSTLLTEQRAALTTIIEAPQVYVPRIRQTLRDYPRLVRSDWTAANRAVDLAALGSRPIVRSGPDRLAREIPSAQRPTIPSRLQTCDGAS
jgi:hypothetical protein